MKAWQNLTHMFNSADCCVEMKKKFGGTILGIKTKENQKPIYCKYHRYNDNYQHQFITENDDRVVLNPDTEAEVFIPDPPRGMYNTENGVVEFFRLPYRQHRRGLCEDTAQIVQFKHVVTSNMIGNYNEFFPHIFSVLNKQLQEPMPLSIATKKAEEFTSYAANRQFVVSLSHTQPEGFSLFYETSYIGQIDPNTYTIKVEESLFKQELLDFLRNDPGAWRIV